MRMDDPSQAKHLHTSRKETYCSMKEMKSVCIVTQDVRRLSDFYAGVLELSPDGDDSFVLFSSPGIQMSISSMQIMEWMAPGLLIGPCAGNFFLEFKVEDVDQEYERLKALQVEVIKPPSTHT